MNIGRSWTPNDGWHSPCVHPLKHRSWAGRQYRLQTTRRTEYHKSQTGASYDVEKGNQVGDGYGTASLLRCPLYANTGHVAAWGDALSLNATFLLSPSPIRRRDANPLPDQRTYPPIQADQLQVRNYRYTIIGFRGWRSAHFFRSMGWQFSAAGVAIQRA